MFAKVRAQGRLPSLLKGRAFGWRRRGAPRRHFDNIVTQNSKKTRQKNINLFVQAKKRKNDKNY
jgi:hypothetical protein